MLSMKKKLYIMIICIHFSFLLLIFLIFFCEIAILENCILFFYEFPILSSFFPLHSFLKKFFLLLLPTMHVFYFIAAIYSFFLSISLHYSVDDGHFMNNITYRWFLFYLSYSSFFSSSYYWEWKRKWKNAFGDDFNWNSRWQFVVFFMMCN